MSRFFLVSFGFHQVLDVMILFQDSIEEIGLDQRLDWEQSSIMTIRQVLRDMPCESIILLWFIITAVWWTMSRSDQCRYRNVFDLNSHVTLSLYILHVLISSYDSYTSLPHKHTNEKQGLISFTYSLWQNNRICNSVTTVLNNAINYIMALESKIAVFKKKKNVNYRYSFQKPMP